MVSLESTLMTGNTQDEYDATRQEKLNMMSGQNGPSFLTKRLNRKVTAETEGTSTTDTDATWSRQESDGSSNASLEGNKAEAFPMLNFDEMPEACAEACNVNTPWSPDPFVAYGRSPDPFDFPSQRQRPVFSERYDDDAAAGAPFQNANPTYLQARAAPMMQPVEVQPMEMQPMEEAQPMMMPPMPPMAPQGMRRWACGRCRRCPDGLRPWHPGPRTIRPER
jgi:hypothetical protein